MATFAQFMQFGPYWNAGVQVTSLNIWHYAAGTTTLQDVWTTRAKASTVAQPAASDANGIVSFYADGLYKFVVKDGTNTLYTYDNVDVLDTSNTGGEGAAIASASTLVLGTDGAYFHVTGAVTITAISGTQNSVTLTFDSTPQLTNSGTLVLSGGLNYTCIAGDSFIFVNDGAGVWREVSRANKTWISGLAIGVNATSPVADSAQTTLVRWDAPVLRSYLAGLGMSTAGGSTTMTIAAGMAADSTNVRTLTLASSLAKTTNPWAVGAGNGGLDTGGIASSTWYHFWLIIRVDTNVVDVLMSLSATAPTMPANYTLKRRIGAAKTDGSSNWTAFTQDGDYFRWAASILDVSTNNPGTSAVTATLTVPTGINVIAIFNGALLATGGGASSSAHFSDIAATDEAGSLTVAPLHQLATLAQANDVRQGGLFFIRTNTSAQIRYRLHASAASNTIYVATLGWLDTRGRNA